MLLSRGKKLTVCVLCFLLAITVVPLNIFENVNADTFISYDDEAPSSTITFRSIEDYEYNAEVKELARWTGHSNIEITFTNTGDETIHDWYFTFDYNYEIENPYNCYVLEHEDNLYTIGNNDWNQDILPGESVSIGFTAASEDGSEISEEPTFYLLNTKTVEILSSDLAWSFEQYSDWTTGFSGALILTNNSEEQIRDWTITFDSNRPITQIDAAVLSTEVDGVYTISNDGNNQNIAAGQSYRIELQGGEHDPSESFALTDYTVSAKALAYTLDEDNDDNGIVDVREIDFTGIVTVTPTATPIPTATSTPIVTNTPSPTAIPTTAPTINPTSTVTPTPSPAITITPSTSATPTPTAIPTGVPDDIDYEKDSDSDGLPDAYEDYIGADKNNPDTDSDGVNDLYEFVLSTDPLTPDSNGNNDYDSDGLTNAQESALGTSPIEADTDSDGLTDGEEVNTFGTDPRKYDTDDDEMSDYSEVNLGSDPLIPDSDVMRPQTIAFEPSDDSSLSGVTKVTVSGYISGCINENTQICDIYGKDLHTSSIEALVGDPVNIETTGEFNSMTITFYYTDGLNENNLRIMWYDEENCEYVVLDNYSINKSRNTISVTTTHFSKYMLIDEEVWVNTWIDACCEAGYISNIGNAYSLPLYIRRLNNKYDDNDGDGIVDILETSGMINNIGHVVYTDPGKMDTDSDDLSDGYEMGEFGVVGDIISYSKYTKYLDAWPVSLGSLYEDYVFLKQKSSPVKGDSDEDGVLDGEDYTPNELNPDAVYIFYDDKWTDNAVFWENKYKKDYKVMKYDCEDWTSFKSLWSSLGELEGKEAHNTDRVILLYDGDLGAFILNFDDPSTWVISDWLRKEYPYYALISDLENKNIRVLDLKICHGGELSAIVDYPISVNEFSQNEEKRCNLAIQFLVSVPGISNVRAWDGTYIFTNGPLGHYERSYNKENASWQEWCLNYSRSAILTDYDVVIDGRYVNKNYANWVNFVEKYFGDNHLI